MFPVGKSSIRVEWACRVFPAFFRINEKLSFLTLSGAGLTCPFAYCFHLLLQDAFDLKEST